MYVEEERKVSFSGSMERESLHKPIQPKEVWQPKMEVGLEKMG